MILSYSLRIFRNIVFFEHRFFVELSHFCASLFTSSVLDLFSDELHISSIVTLDLPIDFFVQSLENFNASPRSLFNEQMEDEQVKDEPPNPELGSPAPAPPEDRA